MLNQRGQEFSVFKLLISAIVAIVILTLLLQILGIINFNPNTDPANAAENLLKAIDSSPYQPKVTDRLDFTSENTINTASLAESTGLSRDQICLLVEDGLTGFNASTQNSISYTGSSTVRVKIVGICADQQDLAEAHFTEFLTDYVPQLSGKNFTKTCTFATGLKSCLLVLIRSNE
ncbi:MAG: hypothetical protein ABIJ74_04430 [archaeon]